jgi:hypothetical protein
VNFLVKNEGTPKSGLQSRLEFKTKEFSRGVGGSLRSLLFHWGEKLGGGGPPSALSFRKPAEEERARGHRNRGRLNRALGKAFLWRELKAYAKSFSLPALRGHLLPRNVDLFSQEFLTHEPGDKALAPSPHPPCPAPNGETTGSYGRVSSGLTCG